MSKLASTFKNRRSGAEIFHDIEDLAKQGYKFIRFYIKGAPAPTRKQLEDNLNAVIEYENGFSVYDLPR